MSTTLLYLEKDGTLPFQNDQSQLPAEQGVVFVHIHDAPTGAAFALKMRPTTTPSASTSKSSSSSTRRRGDSLTLA
jgi:hypothetical protein